jgi:hypothetical protein
MHSHTKVRLAYLVYNYWQVQCSTVAVSIERAANRRVHPRPLTSRFGLQGQWTVTTPAKPGQKGATGPRPVPGRASSTQNRIPDPQIDSGECFPSGDVSPRFGCQGGAAVTTQNRVKRNRRNRDQFRFRHAACLHNL